LSFNTTFVKVNSDKNIKRKEMKNNYSRRDNNTHVSAARSTYTAGQVSNAFVTQNPNY